MEGQLPPTTAKDALGVWSRGLVKMKEKYSRA
jgi:hypothetical protein